MPSTPITLPVAEWTPDMPAFQGGSQNMRNVLPRTPTSYGPLSNIQTYSGPLMRRCQGAFACLDALGNVSVFTGDAKDLYRLTGGTTGWSTVSGGSSPYNSPADQLWLFVLFGQRVLATEINDPIQSYLLGTSATFSDLAYGGITALQLTQGGGYTPGSYTLTPTNTGGGSGFAGTVTVGVDGKLDSFAISAPGRLYGSGTTMPVPAGAGPGTGGAVVPVIAAVAPKARYAAIVRNFLVAANTNDPANGAQPQRVWWSALNDPTNWPTPGTAAAAQVQSDYNDLLGSGGWIQGIVGNLGTADGAVFMERAVWRMVYAGPPAVFYFFAAEGVRGTPSPGSIVQIGPLVYYLGRDGFYVFDGTTSRPIGVNKVDKYFYATVDQNNMARVVGTFDPINKLVIWAWPDTSATNGNPNHLLIYNWQLDRWSIADVTLEHLTTLLSFGYTLDSMNPLGTLDSMPQLPLDSRAWTGGKDILAAFDTSHQLNYFTGQNLAATIDLGEQQPFPGRRAQVKNARPLVDGGTPSVAVGTRNRLVDSVSFNSATAMNSLGACPQRANGRYVRGEITIPAGTNWTHCQGLELEATPAGIR